MSPPLSYEQLMLLSEEELRTTYTLGVVRSGKQTWRACKEGEEAELSLAQLLAAKRSLEEKPRLLHKDSTQGYTAHPALAMRGEPEAVDEGTQAGLAAGAHLRFAEREKERRAEGVARDDARRVAARLKSLVVRATRAGEDTTPVLAQVEIVLRRAEASLASDKMRGDSEGRDSGAAPGLSR